MSKQRKRHQSDRTPPAAPAKQADHLDEVVTVFGTITDTFARHSSIHLLNQDRRQRALVAYIFGMLLAYGKREGVQPPTVMGAMTMLLVTKFGYTLQSADLLTHALINATEPGYDPVHHTLMYRGIAGLPRWTAADPQPTINDFLACLASIEVRSPR